MRRVWSIAILTFREAMHNKVLLACAFFAVMIVLVRLAVFAVGGEELWVNVAQFTRIALLLVLMTGVVVTIMIVSPSLSQDVRSKVIHTVIPKPIHRVEILLGKVLGFTATVAVILAAVALTMLAVVRLTVWGKTEGGLRRLLAAEVKVPASGIRFSGGYISYMKRSTRRWINPTIIETEEDRRERTEYDAGSIKFIPGEAIVSFEDIRPRDLGGQPLRFELTFGVNAFGGGAGEAPELSVVITNRQTGDRVIQGRRAPDDTEREPFRIRENIPRRIEVPNAFIGDGASLDISIRTFTRKTRIGIERTDVVLLLGDRSYEANFLKAMVILFFEMFLVVVVAVMSSTFLTGLIAILFTSVVWVGGHLLGWVGELLGQWARTGRGPLVEITHELQPGIFQPQTPLDWVLDFTNSIFRGVMTAVSYLFPNLRHFDGAWLLSRNVNISGSMVWQAIEFSLLYSTICFVIGYACFRVKEVAR